MARKGDKLEPCEFCAGVTVVYETVTKRKVVHCPRCLYRKHWENGLGWVIDEWPTCPRCGERMTGVDQGQGAGFEIKCPKCGDTVISEGVAAGPETGISGKEADAVEKAGMSDLFSAGAEPATAADETGEIPKEVPLPEEGKV